MHHGTRRISHGNFFFWCYFPPFVLSRCCRQKIANSFSAKELFLRHILLFNLSKGCYILHNHSCLWHTILNYKTKLLLLLLSFLYSICCCVGDQGLNNCLWQATMSLINMSTWNKAFDNIIERTKNFEHINV